VEQTLLLAGSGLVAGVFGALLGLGGGILIVPLLTIGFGLPFRESVAVSLIAVITTSSAGASVYLRRHVANLRLGMTLELATAIGAIVGGLAAFALSERVLAAAFAVMLGYTAITMLRARRQIGPAADELPAPPATRVGTADPDAATEITPSDTSFAASLGGPEYSVRRLPAGLALSVLAGVVSALLGVGGGVVKVPAMHVVMGVPLRVATATSNLMIGVTASASAVLYLARGALDPYVAGPVIVGVFVGASAASRVAHRIPVGVLRLLFVVVLGYVTLEMAARAAGISLLGGVGG
jgi:uncharacterized membrane protein YfcA